MFGPGRRVRCDGGVGTFVRVLVQYTMEWNGRNKICRYGPFPRIVDGLRGPVLSAKKKIKKYYVSSVACWCASGKLVVVRSQGVQTS